MKQLKIIYRDIKELKPYSNNPRHNQDAVDAVAMSIKEFGFKVPVIIDSNGEIVAGHTRIMAAETLGMKKIPCIIADDLTEAQIKAFRIADNKVSELSTWNPALLTMELQELAEMDFDITLTGFSEDEITANIEPHNIDDLLTELDLKSAVEKPIWVSIRTDAANRDKLETGLKTIEKHGIRVERSYD